MKTPRALVLLVLAGCGAMKANGGPDSSVIIDGNPGNDAPIGCTTNVTFDPASPIEGDMVTATATISNLVGFPTPRWGIKFNNVDPVDYVALDALVVRFTAAKAGAYQVHFDTGDPFACAVTDATLQVNKPGANQQSWRLRVIPPATGTAPPQERVVTVSGGIDNAFGTLQIDPGLDVVGSVVDDGGAPVAAYLRFVPEATPDVTIETFSASGGAYDVRVDQGKHDVLIVPASEAIAPARIAGWTASAPQLALPAADTITGTVLDPAGQPLAGARVALSIAGVPTTIATTDGGGAWSVLGHAGGAVDVTVVPPDASGLPRLQVRGATLDVAQPIAIRYASGLTTVDLGGATIRAAGADAPGARVTFTGAIANAGTITVGTKSVTAPGVVATIARADANAALLPQKIVAAPVSAIVETSPTVEAVLAMDLAGGRPAVIDAPAPVTVAGTIVDPNSAARGNVRVRLTPIGALAAGSLLVPAATTDAAGHFAITAAPGGHYALSAVDLARQYAETDVADVTAGDAGTLALGRALVFSGKISVLGGDPGLDNAAISILCATCAGVDRSRAEAEAVTSGGGMFRLVVPDPGTNP